MQLSIMFNPIVVVLFDSTILVAGKNDPPTYLSGNRQSNQIWCAKSLRHVLSVIIKVNLKIATILITSAFSFVWSRKAGKLAKIRKIEIKLNLEHPFHPNMIFMIECTK